MKRQNSLSSILVIDGILVFMSENRLETLSSTSTCQTLLPDLWDQFKTLAHWFNRGTRLHAVSSGSRLSKTDNERQLVMNNYQIKINNNKIKLSRAKTDKEKEKYRERIERLTDKFQQFKNAKLGRQKGAVTKGITAHQFIGSIQRDVDSKAEAITLKLLQECVADYLNKR